MQVDADRHESHTRRLLDEVAAGNAVSQRTLASTVGIALGLTNLLLKRVVRKGWVRMTRVQPNRVRYLITPAGIAAKARLTRAYLSQSVHLYADARQRVGAQLALMSAESGESPSTGRQRVVFWGAGELAEIAFVCLQGTDHSLLGVVDDGPRSSFCGHPVHRSSSLRATTLDGVPFDRLIVTELDGLDETRMALERIRFPMDRVFWL